MEMGERSKGKLSHASSYGSSRADRFHGGVSPPETYWKNRRGDNPSSSNWQKDRRQAGGTDNPAVNYHSPDRCRRLKKLAIPNTSVVNYSSVQNTDSSSRCPQNHRSTRNEVSIVNNMRRKDDEYKEDIGNDADDDEDDDDELVRDAYYDEGAIAGEEGGEDQDGSCGSCETAEKNRDDFDEDVDDNYEIPPSSQRFSSKYIKEPSLMMERLKMLGLNQAIMKLNYQRRLQEKYQEMTNNRRGCQRIIEHHETDEATEDEDELSSRSFSYRKSTKQPITYRQPTSWLSARNRDRFSPIRSSEQAYHYSRKNDTTESALEPLIESHERKRTCRYCGGTGRYPSDLVIERKNNCRVHEPTEVSFKTKAKFDGESGDPGERRSSGRRISQRSNFPTSSPTTLSPQKSRRSRTNRSPSRE